MHSYRKQKNQWLFSSLLFLLFLLFFAAKSSASSFEKQIVYAILQQNKDSYNKLKEKFLDRKDFLNYTFYSFFQPYFISYRDFSVLPEKSKYPEINFLTTLYNLQNKIIRKSPYKLITNWKITKPFKEKGYFDIDKEFCNLESLKSLKFFRKNIYTLDNGVLPLEKIYPDESGIVYILTMFHTAEQTRIDFFTYSLARIKLFVDTKIVNSSIKYGNSLLISQVTVSSGWHTLLIKIQRNNSHWNISCGYKSSSSILFEFNTKIKKTGKLLHYKNKKSAFLEELKQKYLKNTHTPLNLLKYTLAEFFLGNKESALNMVKYTTRYTNLLTLTLFADLYKINYLLENIEYDSIYSKKLLKKIPSKYKNLPFVKNVVLSSNISFPFSLLVYPEDKNLKFSAEFYISKAYKLLASKKTNKVLQILKQGLIWIDSEKLKKYYNMFLEFIYQKEEPVNIFNKKVILKITEKDEEIIEEAFKDEETPPDALIKYYKNLIYLKTDKGKLYSHVEQIFKVYNKDGLKQFLEFIKEIKTNKNSKIISARLYKNPIVWYNIDTISITNLPKEVIISLKYETIPLLHLKNTKYIYSPIFYFHYPHTLSQNTFLLLDSEITNIEIEDPDELDYKTFNSIKIWEYESDKVYSSPYLYFLFTSFPDWREVYLYLMGEYLFKNNEFPYIIEKDIYSIYREYPPEKNQFDFLKKIYYWLNSKLNDKKTEEIYKFRNIRDIFFKEEATIFEKSFIFKSILDLFGIKYNYGFILKSFPFKETEKIKKSPSPELILAPVIYLPQTDRYVCFYNRFLPFESFPPRYTGTNLVLFKNKDVVYKRVPFDKNSFIEEKGEVFLEENNLKFNIQIEYNGSYNIIKQQLQQEKIKKVFENFRTEIMHNKSIESNLVVKITGEFNISKFKKGRIYQIPYKYIVPLNYFRIIRYMSIEEFYYQKSKIELILEKSLNIEKIPEDIKIENEAGKYIIRFKKKSKNRLLIKREIMIKGSRYFYTFLSGIERLEKRKIIIVKGY